jgi:hypothetical protein
MSRDRAVKDVESASSCLPSAASATARDAPFPLIAPTALIYLSLIPMADLREAANPI